MRLRTILIINCVAAFAGIAHLHAVAKPVLPTSKAATTIPEGPKIRVLLEKNVPSALLEAKGEYAVVNRSTGEILSVGPIGKRYVVHALPDGLRWGEEYPDVFQICVIPKNSATSMYVNGIQYKGAISVYHCKDNRVAVVNDVPIEDFVKSTLSVEIPETYSKEALAAIAIAARTEAFAKTKASTSKRPWDLTADEANYFGYAVIPQKTAVREAVDWTRFMVLESSREGELVPKLDLSFEKAQALAEKGYDAKKILQNACPTAKLNVTAMPKQKAIR